MFITDQTKRILSKVIYFYPYGICKANNTFEFFSVCIFETICLSESCSMENIKAQKFVVVGDWWRVEAGADHGPKKFS